MSCKGCNDRSVIKGITGAWFAKLGDETLQIAYCPQCGTLLDEETAKTPRRVKAALAEVRRNSIIERIKRVRASRGVSLKEAADIVHADPKAGRVR